MEFFFALADRVGGASLRKKNINGRSRDQRQVEGMQRHGDDRFMLREPERLRADLTSLVGMRARVGFGAVQEVLEEVDVDAAALRVRFEPGGFAPLLLQGVAHHVAFEGAQDEASRMAWVVECTSSGLLPGGDALFRASIPVFVARLEAPAPSLERF